MAKGPLFALLAALLFGLSTPLAKLLLGQINSHLLAGLLYFGSGVGLGVVFLWNRQRSSRVAGDRKPTLHGSDWLWLSAAIASGGIVSPVLLMTGLARTGATSASLMLNLEGVVTALLAWFVFRENVNRRVACGFFFIAVGGGFVSWSNQRGLHAGIPALFIGLACLCWGFDNNFTRKISHTDPVFLAMAKGLVAGIVNIGLAFIGGTIWPALPLLIFAMALGLLSYGISLVFFIIGLRHIGAARSGAYFATAPFIGAVVAGAVFKESLAKRPAGFRLKFAHGQVRTHDDTATKNPFALTSAPIMKV